MLKSIHKQLNFGQTKNKFSTVQKILIFLILLSSVIVILETENEIFESNKEFFEYSKYFFGIIFTVEYLLRVFTAGYLKKYRGIKFDSNDFNDQCLTEIKVHQNVVLEDLTKNVNQKLLFSLCNIIEQDNKYLIITSLKPIVQIKFDLVDLLSRTKNFLLQSIDKPDDELMFALIIKNLSDRQISIEKKLVNYIVKRIDRSYGKIFDFIYKIDEISLKKKKPIDLKTIKEALGE